MGSLDAPPLRIGLLVDSLLQPAWVAHQLKSIVASGIATIALVVVNEQPANVGPASLSVRARKWVENRAFLPYAAYVKLDSWRYRPRPDPFAHVDVADLVVGATILHVTPRRSRFVDRFQEADIASIRACELDVALLLGFRILKGDILTTPKHGVWSFHHGDNTAYRGGPAGFWEVCNQEPTAGAILQVLSDSLDGGRVIARSRSKATPVSLAVTRANCYWEASGLLQRELTVLHREGRVGLVEPDTAWTPYCGTIRTAPRAGDVARFAGRVTTHLLTSRLRSTMRRDQWSLCYHLGSPSSGEGETEAPCDTLYKYTTLQAPPGRHWADPFPVFAEGRHYLFFEEFFFDAPSAHICVVEIGASGSVGTPTVVLERPYHLSYPMVFRWQGNWFMMPECAKTRAVELFRATAFPFAWEAVGQVLSGLQMVDPTVAEIDGQWWLFGATRIEGATEASGLHAYYGPSPLGPWTAHHYNPVKIDVRGARPAGRLFKHGDAYYRPGQDGSPRYGSAVVVHRIDELSPTRFRETAVSRIEPQWQPGLSGCHTINATAGLSAADFRRFIGGSS